MENVLKPDAPFYAVGDIHGRADLLDKLLSQIGPDESAPMVFLGDYIDRGPDAAAALTQLFEMQNRHPSAVICLLGNHEKMMLDFIDDPLGNGANWLKYGGTATLRSFGVADVARQPNPDQAIALSGALEKALTPPLLHWLRRLPLSWNSGNIWCVHAAMDPAAPPDEQKSDVMLWGHRAFLRTPRHDGVSVVHGHTTVSKPSSHSSRIAVDTGACQTSRLTAAYVGTDTCRFITT